MPHYSTWPIGNYHYNGTGLDSHDRQANVDTTYLLNSTDDAAYGERIVPDVYLEEIPTFPSSSASAPSAGDALADTFIWDAAEPMQDNEGAVFPGMTKYPNVKLTRAADETETTAGDYSASNDDASDAATVGAAQSITVGISQAETIGVDDALF